MNMNRSWTPPDNSKILPDLYNVLDAHAMKKTSSINGMLDFHLTTQQNVISRHRYLAERMHREEKVRVTNALSQIHDKLPAVERIRDFNFKFFKNKSLEDFTTNSSKKIKGHNFYDKNDEPICRRCYNHHFAIQRHQLTNSYPLPSIPRNRRFPDNFHGHKPISSNAQHQQQNHPENETENLKNTDPNETENGENNDLLSESEPIPNFLLSDKGANAEGSGAKSRDLAPPPSPTKQAFGWWMPRNKTFQFLQKDQSGREIDVNKHYTPRLMPYEDWKNVVRDVCSHCAHPAECVASRQPRGSIGFNGMHTR